MILTAENQINPRQTCPYPPFFTTNLSLTGLGLNLGPANNCLSVGTLLKLEVHLVHKNSVATLTENTAYPLQNFL